LSAKEKALNYLGRFSRTEQQVADYLARKEFPPEEIRTTIAFLREHKFVDDRAFAETFLQSRLRRFDGPLKIRQMLLQKGIAKALVDSLLKAQYPTDLQIENAAALLEKRISRRSATTERQKLYRFLASRGFPGYVIIQAFELHRRNSK
jgi:regulatory protein